MSNNHNVGDPMFPQIFTIPRCSNGTNEELWRNKAWFAVLCDALERQSSTQNRQNFVLFRVSVFVYVGHPFPDKLLHHRLAWFPPIKMGAIMGRRPR